ncbi:hypothetical protein ABZ512_14435 [Nocardiopsis dassonvillei]|uniref:hypothetical protein n=1 Tax=Nocardiopsis dassonvillei TaxID=2014 RepID=UPI003406741B
MANPTTDVPGYWDRYARGVTPQEPEEALATALEWSQYPGSNCWGNPPPRWNWVPGGATLSPRWPPEG